MGNDNHKIKLIEKCIKLTEENKPDHLLKLLEKQTGSNSNLKILLNQEDVIACDRIWSGILDLIDSVKMNSLINKSFSTGLVNLCLKTDNINLFRFYQTHCSKYNSDPNNTVKLDIESQLNRLRKIEDPYLVCAKNGSAEMMKILEDEYGWYIYVVDKDKRNALHLASINNKLSVVKHLIENKSYDYRRKDSTNYNSFGLAVKNSKIDILKYYEKLMKNKNKKFNIYNNNTDYALFSICAIGGTNFKTFKYLYNQYKDYSKLDGNINTMGDNILMQTIAKNTSECLELVKFLTSVYEWDFNHKNNQGKTALDLAKSKNLKVYELLNKDKLFSKFKVFDQNENTHECLLCKTEIEQGDHYCCCKFNHSLHKSCLETQIYEKGLTDDGITCLGCKAPILEVFFIKK